MTKIDWPIKTKRLLKAELTKRGITYEELEKRLNKIGAEDTLAGIKVKMSRGTFSAVFLLQCLKAIGCESLRIED